MITVQYFGEKTTLTLPPVAPFAILGQFARAERFPLQAPPELPDNRQEALMRGILRGPTKEDIEHFNTQCNTRLISTRCVNSPKSRSHDPDWFRCGLGPYRMPLYTTVGFYAPGTLSGHWQGSSIVSNFFQKANCGLIRSRHLSQTFINQSYLRQMRPPCILPLVGSLCTCASKSTTAMRRHRLSL